MIKFLISLLNRQKQSFQISGKAASVPADLLVKAEDQMKAGHLREALALYLLCLEVEPNHALIHNAVGACYADTGDVQKARHHFGIAYALNDIEPSILANWAKIHIDDQRYEEAHHCLQRLAALGFDFAHMYAVYSGLCMAQGEAELAQKTNLKAWISNFDSLRTANGFLFKSAYAYQSESLLSAEHRFWAATLEGLDSSSSTEAIGKPSISQRIRIAYWSPDFRDHSVRYFFNPLLRAHDRDRFEVHLLYDNFECDKHTDFGREHADYFHDVYRLNDREIQDFIRAQNYDILVELAGHTSFNRINLLSQRLARVQITALGYPPTTGLDTVDFKLADRYIHTPEAEPYYSERLLVLPTSFWCFDPMEPAPLADDPPVVRQGHVTLACVGNLSKISDECLDAWREVMARVPNSRLLLRSIPFVSSFIQEHWQRKLEAAGFSMDRVDLKPPLGGEQFFTSYNDIDLILDTFPFNGGTTTSFAVYMGVPVVSLSGASLISRMGRSILNNVGLADLVVDNWGAYVDKAVVLAHDTERLRMLKQTLRTTMQGNALGNASAFATEFEQACLHALESTQPNAPALAPLQGGFTLPAKELASRAFQVLFAGNTQAAQRINEYAVKLYGESASSLILRSLYAPETLNLDDRSTIEACCTGLPPEQQAALLLYFARRTVLTGQQQTHLPWALEELSTLPLTDAVDIQSLHMLRVYRHCHDAGLASEGSAPVVAVPISASVRLLVVWATDDKPDVAAVENRWRSVLPPAVQIQFLHALVDDRWTCIEREAPRFTHVMLVNAHAHLTDPTHLGAALALLEEHALVGLAGCRRWGRMSWSRDEASECEGMLIYQSQEAQGFFELTLLGQAAIQQAHGFAVLDSALLLFKPELLKRVSPPEDAKAGLLADTEWTAHCAEQGHSLAVDLTLPVILSTPSPSKHTLSQQMLTERVAMERGFDLVKEGLDAKRQHPSLPCETLAMAQAVRHHMIAAISNAAAH